MKVPVPTSGRVVPQQRQAYTEASPNAFAGAENLIRGVSSLGRSLQQAGAVFAERDQKTDRFNSLTGLSKFDSDVTTSLTDLKRNFAPDGRGYIKQAESLYDERAANFLSGVPQDLQEEFRYRIAENKKSVVADSLKFQYEAGDAWFKQGISDELNRSKTLLDQSPQQLEAQRAHMAEVIDATDLPEIEKNNLKRAVNIGLEAATYKAEVRRDASTRAALGVGDPVGVVDKIIGVESGGNANAQNPNSSAGGLGQFIDSTWLNMLQKYRPDVVEGKGREELIALKSDSSLSREMTTRYVEENSKALSRSGIVPNEANVYLAHFLGPQGAIDLLHRNPDTPVDQVLPAGTINANKSILAGKTVGEVKSWAARKMGAAVLEVDSRFQNIPYEDRLALREDAEREAVAAATAEAKAQKAQIEAQTNDLYLGLLDGTKGKADIEAARGAGWLTDYDSINKANNILKEANVQTVLAGEAAQKLSSGGVFDPTDADDKKRLNAYVGKSGLERLGSGDQEYFSDSVLPLVSRVGDIPTDVAGTLMGMVRAQNSQQAMFALDALAQLRDANQIAFDSRVSNDVAAQVDMWDSQKALATDQAVLLDQVRGGTDQATRQARMALRSEAKAILSQVQNGVPNSKALLSQVTNAFDGIFTSEPGLYTNPTANQALEKEFSSLFVDKYSLTGNTQTATDLAIKELRRNWDATSVGGRKILMKYPPEKAGYRPINGSFDWIAESVRKDLGLQEGESFELFSDDKTREDIQNFKRDPSARPPSYRVFTIDKDGVARERVDVNNRPARIWFQPSPEVLAEQADTFDRQAERVRVNEIIENYPRLQAGALASGTQVPEEDTQALNEALKTREALDRAEAEAQQRKATKTLDLENNPYPDQFPPGSF